MHLKIFSETVFCNRLHVGSSLRNIFKNGRYRPFSALFSTHEYDTVGDSQNGSPDFFDNPEPRYRQRASSIYFSRLLALIPCPLYSKDTLEVQTHNELELGECLEPPEPVPLYTHPQTGQRMPGLRQRQPEEKNT